MLGSDISWQVLQVTVGVFASVRQQLSEASQSAHRKLLRERQQLLPVLC